MIDNVTVVIRSSGERTVECCRILAEQQVNSECVFVIEERPFSQAVRKCYEIGIKENRPWTLALDADILIAPGAILAMVDAISNLGDDYFEYQGRILDKLFQAPRNGGPHLYRTSLLETALPLIPKEGTSLRPESHVFDAMQKLNYFRYNSLAIYGLHDYEQYNIDIFRKTFIHSQKHSYLIEEICNCWSAFDKVDGDFRVALLGIEKGKNYKDVVYIDKQWLIEEMETTLVEFNIKEKAYFAFSLDQLNELIKRELFNWQMCEIRKNLESKFSKEIDTKISSISKINIETKSSKILKRVKYFLNQF